ncbi:MAG: galactokinase family protein [Isosphaeraceae bacterium]
MSPSPEDRHLDRFVGDLRKLGGPARIHGRPLFDKDAAIVVARAPGRLDVMGGIADYSGSLVLQWPIREATLVAAQAVAEPGVRVVSLATEDGHEPRGLELDGPTAGHLLADNYDQIRRWFSEDPSRHWAAYVFGVLAVLARERGLDLDCGLNLLVDSRVPEGKGVSSSAALEVATMQAVTRLLGLELDGVELATLCQMAENFVVGAPCGIMDQMTSALGRAHSLLALLCQPADVKASSRSRRRSASGDRLGHPARRLGERLHLGGTGAFMGYRIITDRAGMRALAPSASEPIRVEDPRWSGFLANITPEEFGRDFATHLPETMRGEEFRRGTAARLTGSRTSIRAGRTPSFSRPRIRSASTPGSDGSPSCCRARSMSRRSARWAS